MAHHEQPPYELNVVEHLGVGPHALIVHGALGSRSYWADNLAALSTVCRPVVVELWGHGRSGSPEDPAAYHPEAYVEQFETIRKRVGAERWVTIGQSMGASLLLHYGLAHPERVLAQVITNSSSAFSPLDTWRKGQAALAAPLAEQVLAEGTDLLAEHWVNPGRSKRIPEATRALLAAEFAEHEALGVAYSLKFTNPHLPLAHRLEQITHPTLLTFGVLETPFAALIGQARRIPSLEIVELDAAHAVNAQSPGPWNDAVVAFLRRVLPDHPDHRDHPDHPAHPDHPTHRNPDDPAPPPAP